jgi:hypothetical protein
LSTAATRTPLDTALALAKVGLSVIPIRPDGSKSPALDSWKEFQTRIPSRDEIRSMFSPGLGVAILGGEVSGNLEILDIESIAPFSEFQTLVSELAPELLERLPHVETPSGGHHFYYRSDQIARNQVLARRLDNEVMLETRAEGGYVLTINSPAACHETGREYRLVHGRLTQIPRISPAERSFLLDAARSFNQVVREAKIAPEPSVNGNGTRPGDLYNEREKWTDVIGVRGWKSVRGGKGEEMFWCRPGKDHGISATTNYRGSDVLYVFSTNADPFKHETSYTKFYAYALLNHDGDLTAAARAIARKYELPSTENDDDAIRDAVRQATEEDRSAPPSVSTPQDSRSSWTVPQHWKRLDLANLHDWKCKPLVPVVEGMIAEGTVNYVAAETQTGKTLLFQNMARQLIQSSEIFGKFKITPVDRLLYLVLEDPERRVRDRLVDSEHEFPTPVESEKCIFYVAPGFRLDDERMFAWLESIIEKEGRKVVFLDTYQKSTPGISSFDDEKQSVILHKLADLTRRLSVTLIIIDHVRKRPGTGKRTELSIDDIKGTGGKAQNADCVILMERTPDRKQIKFQAFSKDFDQPVRILLNVAPKGSTEPKFSYAGDLEALGRSRHEQAEARKQAVLEAMQPGEWRKASEIAAAAKVPERSIHRTLKNLQDANLIDKMGHSKNTRYCRLKIEDSPQ